MEKELNLQKLNAFYQKQLDCVSERKHKCLDNLKSKANLNTQLQAIKQSLSELKSALEKKNLDFVLKTLDSDEAKWRDIELQCN